MKYLRSILLEKPDKFNLKVNLLISLYFIFFISKILKFRFNGWNCSAVFWKCSPVCNSRNIFGFTTQKCEWCSRNWSSFNFRQLFLGVLLLSPSFWAQMSFCWPSVTENHPVLFLFFYYVYHGQIMIIIYGAAALNYFKAGDLGWWTDGRADKRLFQRSTGQDWLPPLGVRRCPRNCLRACRYSSVPD